jgi:uncharacterized membrane protein
MTDSSNMMVYTAVYSNEADAMADLETLDDLHKDQLIGKFDAAVIDKRDGKPHIAKRLDRPAVRVIPEWFGGGTLPRKDLKEAAEELTSGQAGLIVVGEPTVEKALETAVRGADKAIKRYVDGTVDEVSNELEGALKARETSTSTSTSTSTTK